MQNFSWPKKSEEIFKNHRTLIYIEATKDPFSYLFINLTQECQPEVKYLSQLFKKDNVVKCFVEST